VGVLMSLVAVLPMALGIFAGRLVDRIGVRRPLIVATAGLAVAIALPGAWPAAAMLYVASVGVGTTFMLFHISAQHAVGEMSSPADRKENFGWLALGFSIANFVGPVFAGLAIDALGHAATFRLQAGLALCALALLASQRERLSHTPRRPARVGGSLRELLANAELRRVFLATGLLASAWDLFLFAAPVYGTQIGMSATTIGLVLASFATATILVRLALPWLSRHLHEWPMITATLCIACVAYAIFPLMRTVPLLASIAFLLGLGLGATQPSILSLIYATAPAGRSAEAIGVRSVVLNTSTTLLPLAFGTVGAALGMLPVFWGMSAALASGAWFANRRRRAAPG
jgi:MFS family permease